MNTSKWQMIIITFTLIFLVNCAGEKHLLLSNGELSGWQVQSTQIFKDRDGFYQHLNGGAELFIQYGLQRLIVQELASGNGHTITVEIYVMKNKKNLNSLFDRFKSFTMLDLGEKGSYSPGNLVFYQGHYFVRLYIDRLYQGAEEDLRSVAGVLDEKLTNK